MKKILIFLLITLFSINSKAQKVYHLNLEKSIEIAKEQNFSILILKKDLERAEFNLKAAKRKFRTKVNLNFEGPEYFQTLGEYRDSTGVQFYPYKEFNYDGKLTIDQTLPTNGKISLSTGLYNARNFYEDERSVKLAGSINFEQPIIALYSYNNIRSTIKAAELNYEATLKSFKREELDLIYEVSRAYYNFLAEKLRTEIANQTLIRQQDAYNIAQNKYNAGLIREVEALQIEVDLGQAQNDYDLAVANYESQANNFKLTLNLPLEDSITLEKEITYNIINIDVQKAIENGLNNRLEIREREINIELSKIDLKRQKSEGQVQGDINAHYGLSGFDKSTLPLPFSSSYSYAYQNMIHNIDDYGIGLTIRIPIIDWGENKSRVKANLATIEMNKYRLDEEKINIEREIRNTVNQLQSALRRLQLLEKNVQLAEKSFEISDFRFKNGDIDSEALALDRERLSKTRLSFLEAYISYKLLIADLTRKTFYDFEKDMPVI